MGIYLNPGPGRFERAVNSKIYVDKTGLIAEVNAFRNTEQQYACVSRPRRFGKSMALGMMAAYYDHTIDTRELFAPFEIAKHPSFEATINKYDVLLINMMEFLSMAGSTGGLAGVVTEELASDMTEVFGQEIAKRRNLALMMKKAYQQSKRQFVILIDEWDCLFRERPHDIDGHREYLDFLRDWLKDQEYVAVAYMTGILPVKKYGKQSALNMFSEYSMPEQAELARFTGFTQEEVTALCVEHNRDERQMAEWYNGYRLDDGRGQVCDIYAPRSVVESIRKNNFAGYWARTSSWESVRAYLLMEFDGLKDAASVLVAGGRVSVDIGDFSNDTTSFASRDSVLTLLVHYGYLGYDRGAGEVYIPNREVQSEFVTAMKTGGWERTIAAVQASGQLLKDTWAGNADAVAAAIQGAHMETSHLTYNSETALRYTLALAYYAARDYYTTVHEFPSGNGFADLAFIPHPYAPGNPAMLIELKWDREADAAIAQIRRKNYPAGLAAYAKENGGEGILLVGVTYDKETRSHECVIERA